MPIPQHVRLLDPWQELSPDRAIAFSEQLKRELSPSHILHGTEAKAVAERIDQDDALFELVGHQSLLAVVHLTWIDKPPANPDPEWPATLLFASWDDWGREILLPDHEGLGDSLYNHS